MCSHFPPSSQYLPLHFTSSALLSVLSHFPHTLNHLLFGMIIFTRNLGPGSSPSEDAQWIREELHRWIHGRLHCITAILHSICPYYSQNSFTCPHFLPLYLMIFLPSSPSHSMNGFATLYLCFSLHPRS
jgi:hypothetical protein